MLISQNPLFCPWASSGPEPLQGRTGRLILFRKHSAPLPKWVLISTLFHLDVTSWVGARNVWAVLWLLLCELIVARVLGGSLEWCGRSAIQVSANWLAHAVTRAPESNSYIPACPTMAGGLHLVHIFISFMLLFWEHWCCVIQWTRDKDKRVGESVTTSVFSFFPY